MLSYQALSYFVQIAHAPSLSVAAENLHITRQALSAAIKSLEKELGYSLLERSSTGICLTAEGEKVLALAQKSLAYLEEIRKIEPEKERIVPSFSVYSAYSLGNTFLPQLMQAYYRKYPNGDFRVQMQGTRSIEEVLEADPMAFVIGIYPANTEFPFPLRVEILDLSDSYLVMDKDAIVVPQELNQITLADLAQIPLVLYQTPENQLFQNRILQEIRCYHEPNICHIVPGIEMLHTYLKRKSGGALYIGFKYGDDPKKYGWRLLRISDAPKFMIALVYHHEMPQENVQLFLNLLEQMRE